MESRESTVKVIDCACGFRARDANEDRLVSILQEHAREVHSMEFNWEQVLAMAHPE